MTIPHSSSSLMTTPMHQVMWMTSQKSPWPQLVASETGVPGAPVRHRGTAPTNGSFSGCPGLEGRRHVGGPS